MHCTRHPTMSDQASSSSPTPSPNPNRPRPEESPRRRSGRANAPPSSPHRGLEGSSSAPRPCRELTLAPVQRPPVMGVPGQSAFAPYNRPRPSHPRWPAGGSSSGPRMSAFGFAVGHGFQAARAVPIGGSGYGGAVPGGGQRIIGWKRSRDSAEGNAAAAGGNQQGEAGGNAINCSVCGKGFMSDKALFGHMRSHPDRGWKGAHPPPAFRAEEEFADLRSLNQPEGLAAGGGGEDQEGDAGGAREGLSSTGRREQVERGGQEEEEPGNYQLPDLNNPPPPDAN